MNKVVYIEGEGCNRRLLEKSKLYRYLRSNEYKFTDRPASADYIILYTCAFKKDEEDYSSKRLKALQNYKGRLLVFGCLPDIAPHRIENLRAIHKIAPKDLDKIDDFFDGIHLRYADIDNPHAIQYSHKADLFQRLRRNLFRRDVIANSIRHISAFFGRPGRLFYIMVCRGCLGKCSYCAIRRAVGSVNSKPVEAVVAEFREGIKAGYRDFVLLGDDLGSYGLDGPGTLPALMVALQREMQKIIGQTIRIHLKEVHPKYLLHYEGSLRQLLDSPNIASLLCPIQSGSPRILDLMQREHSVEDIKRVLGKIRQINPDIEISTQIIAGFPTETEEEFQATLDLVAQLNFRWLVVFPFDPKHGTPAAAMEGQVPGEIIRKRVKKAIKHLRQRGIRAFTKCPW